MQSKLTIEITWNDDVREDHKEQLEVAGMERAFEMMADGYSSGELNADLEYQTKSGRTKEINYRGWWSRTIEQI